MKAESVVFAVVGAFFGLIVGWILGSQQPGFARPAAPAPAAQAAAAPAGTPAPPRLDESRARELAASAGREPRNAAVRIELGNLYFDGERYGDAVRWYKEALALDPRNVDVSTDLGVSYYYMNDADRALKQFEHSLLIDPRHTKTILNMGIVRAFGKQDLDGAAAAWQTVIDLAPDSPEGQAAKRALDSLRSAHPGVGGESTSPGG